MVLMVMKTGGLNRDCWNGLESILVDCAAASPDLFV